MVSVGLVFWADDIAMYSHARLALKHVILFKYNFSRLGFEVFKTCKNILPSFTIDLNHFYSSTFIKLSWLHDVTVTRDFAVVS